MHFTPRSLPSLALFVLYAALSFTLAGCDDGPADLTTAQNSELPSEAGSTTGSSGGAFFSEDEVKEDDEFFGDVDVSDIAQEQEPDPNRKNIQLDPVATSLAGRPIFLSAAKVVRFSHDGKLLAVGHGNGNVHVWDVANARHDLTFMSHEEWAFDVAFSADDARLATAGGDNKIRLYDLSNLDSHKTRPRQKGDKHSMVYREHGKTLARHGDDVHGVAFTPDGAHLVTGGDDAQVIVWDLKSNEPKELSGHTKQVTAVAIDASGTLAASASRDATIRLWKLPNGEEAAVLKEHAADVISIDFSPDGKTLAAVDYDGKVILWDVDSSKPARTIDAHEGRSYAVAYHPNGKMVASGGDDNMVKLWNANDGQLLKELPAKSIVAGLTFSPDGKSLAAATSSGTVALFDVANKSMENQNLLIPPGFIPAPKAVPRERPDAATSLLQHNTAAWTKNPTWPTVVGTLSRTGDAFTVELLQGIDSTSLSPANQELLMRTVATLQQRVSPDTAESIVPIIEWRLERAALSDLNCGVLEGKVVPWTMKSIQAFTENAKVKVELQRIASSYVPRNESNTVYDSLQKRVRKYASDLLKPKAKE